MIARGRHHGDSGAVGGLGRLAQRVGRKALHDRVPQGEVDHANVVLTLQFNGALDGGDDPADRPLPVQVEHLKIDDVRAWRDPTTVDLNFEPVELVPFAAMMPATCVPWPKSSV